MKNTKFNLKHSPKKSKKIIFLVAGVILVLLLSSGTYAFLRHRDNQQKANQETRQSDAPPEDGAAAETSNPSVEGDKPIVTQYQGDSVSNNPNLTGIINYKSVVGDNLVIRVTIDQVLSSGSCALTLTDASKTKSVTRTADISQNPSSSTCQGFDVPISELKSGEWSMIVKVNGNNKTGDITGKITI